MDVAGLDLLQILYVILSIAGVIGAFSLIAVLKTYAQQRLGAKVTFDWRQVLDYVPLAVNAVEQMRKVRPEGLTDKEWNNLRLNDAITLVKAYAATLGLTISDDFITAVRGAIEAAISRAKKPALPTSGTMLFNAPQTSVLPNGLITG